MHCVEYIIFFLIIFRTAWRNKADTLYGEASCECGGVQFAVWTAGGVAQLLAVELAGTPKACVTLCRETLPLPRHLLPKTLRSTLRSNSHSLAHRTLQDPTRNLQGPVRP